MPSIVTRLSDLTTLTPMADPQTGLSASEILPTIPTTLNAAVTDTGLVELPASRVKTVAVVVTTTLTWVTAGQPTVQLFAARTRYGTLGGDTAAATGGPIGWQAPQTPFVGSEGAASGFPTGNAPNSCTLIGTAANLGPAAATSLAANIYWFSPSSLAELQWWYPVLGLEVKFPSALTAGAFIVTFEVGPL